MNGNYFRERTFMQKTSRLLEQCQLFDSKFASKPSRTLFNLLDYEQQQVFFIFFTFSSDLLKSWATTFNFLNAIR